MEEALFAVCCRPQGIKPHQEALRGAHLVPRVGEEGRPRRTGRRKCQLFTGIDRRGV